MRIRYDKETGAFVGYCPITEVYSQGATPEEARKATEDGVRLYRKIRSKQLWEMIKNGGVHFA